MAKERFVVVVGRVVFGLIQKKWNLTGWKEFVVGVVFIVASFAVGIKVPIIMARKQETDLTGSASNNKNRRAFCGPYALSYRKGRENASKKVSQAGHAASVSLVCARMRANSA